MDSSARWRIIGWYALLAGTLLRFMNLSLWPLWCDELATFQRTQLPLSEHLQLVSKRPPLYELLMRLWVHPGISDTALRIPSAAFGLVAMWIVWRMTRSAIGERGAAIAAGLMAFSPLHLMFSRIARSYSLAVMLAAISMYAAWKVYTDGRRRWLVAYGIATLLALYTDSVMCAIVIAQNVFCFAMLWRERRRLAGWIVAQACVGVLFAPWILFSGKGAVIFADVVPYAASALGPGPKAAYLAFAVCAGETVNPVNWWIVAPAFVGFGGAFIAGTIRLVRHVRSLAVFAITPAILAFAVAMLFAAGSPKHLSVMLPPMMIILAVGIIRARPVWLGWVFGGLIFATGCVSIFNYYTGREFADASMATPWRQIAETAQKNESANDSVFIGWRTFKDGFGNDKDLFARYYRGSAPVAFLWEGHWQSQVTAAVAKGGHAWLLIHRDEPREQIEAWLKGQHYVVQQTPFQEEEETLRWLKQGGPRENYRSYLYKLYQVQGEPREPTP